MTVRLELNLGPLLRTTELSPPLFILSGDLIMQPKLPCLTPEFGDYRPATSFSVVWGFFGGGGEWATSRQWADDPLKGKEKRSNSVLAVTNHPSTSRVDWLWLARWVSPSSFTVRTRSWREGCSPVKGITCCLLRSTNTSKGRRGHPQQSSRCLTFTTFQPEATFHAEQKQPSLTSSEVQLRAYRVKQTILAVRTVTGGC